MRRATPTDASAAAALITRVLAEYGLPFEPQSRDADVALFGSRDDHDAFVEERGGEIVGVVDIGPHGDPGVAWVSKLFVSPSVRRAGVGRALLRAAHDAARARGYRMVGLRSRIVFAEALALYAAEGYARQDPGAVRIDAGDVVFYRDL